MSFTIFYSLWAVYLLQNRAFRKRQSINHHGNCMETNLFLCFCVFLSMHKQKCWSQNLLCSTGQIFWCNPSCNLTDISHKINSIRAVMQPNGRCLIKNRLFWHKHVSLKMFYPVWAVCHIPPNPNGFVFLSLRDYGFRLRRITGGRNIWCKF